VLSLISLCIVLYTPLDINVREGDKNYSPYRDEIDKLRPKAESGMKLSEYEYYESLIEKNSRWFEEERAKNVERSAASALNAWKKKSSRLAPAIVVLWAFSFYLYFRRKPPKNQAWLALTFPVLLTVAGLMSLLEGVLIAFVVSLI